MEFAHPIPSAASPLRSPSPFLDDAEREAEEWTSSDSDCSVVFTAIATTPVRRKMDDRLKRIDKRRSRQTLILQRPESDEEDESGDEFDDGQEAEQDATVQLDTPPRRASDSAAVDQQLTSPPSQRPLAPTRALRSPASPFLSSVYDQSHHSPVASTSAAVLEYDACDDERPSPFLTAVADEAEQQPEVEHLELEETVEDEEEEGESIEEEDAAADESSEERDTEGQSNSDHQPRRSSVMSVPASPFARRRSVTQHTPPPSPFLQSQQDDYFQSASPEAEQSELELDASPLDGVMQEEVEEDEKEAQAEAELLSEAPSQPELEEEVDEEMDEDEDEEEEPMFEENDDTLHFDLRPALDSDEEADEAVAEEEEEEPYELEFDETTFRDHALLNGLADAELGDEYAEEDVQEEDVEEELHEQEVEEDVMMDEVDSAEQDLVAEHLSQEPEPTDGSHSPLAQVAELVDAIQLEPVEVEIVAEEETELAEAPTASELESSSESPAELVEKPLSPASDLAVVEVAAAAEPAEASPSAAVSELVAEEEEPVAVAEEVGEQEPAALVDVQAQVVEVTALAESMTSPTAMEQSLSQPSDTEVVEKSPPSATPSTTDALSSPPRFTNAPPPTLTASTLTPQAAAPVFSHADASTPLAAGSLTPSSRAQVPAAHAAPAAKRQLAAGGFRPTRPVASETLSSRPSGLVVPPKKTVASSTVPAAGLKKLVPVVVIPRPKFAPTSGVARGIKPPSTTAPVASTSRLPQSRPGAPPRSLPTLVKRPTPASDSDAQPTARPPSASGSNSSAGSTKVAAPTVARPKVLVRPGLTVAGVKAPTSTTARVGVAPGPAGIRRVVAGSSASRPPIRPPTAAPAPGGMRPPATFKAPGSLPAGRVGSAALNASTSSNSSVRSNSSAAVPSLVRPRPAFAPSRPPPSASVQPIVAAPPPSVPEPLVTCPMPLVAPVPEEESESEPAPVVLAPPAPPPAPLPLLPRPVAANNGSRVDRSPKKAQRTGGLKEGAENGQAAVRQRITPPPGAEPMIATHRSIGSVTLNGARPIFGPASPTRTAPEIASVTLAPLTENPLTAAVPASAVAQEIFAPVEPTPVKPAVAPLPRPERMRKPKPIVEQVDMLSSAELPAPLPLPVPRSRSARPASPTGDAAPTAESAPAPAPAPLPRPSRKAALAAAAAAAEAEAEAARALATTPVSTRAPLVITPAPYLTVDQLTQLTQKYTRMNKAHFNKLDVQTILMDTNRPPSPTSKIRKSLAPGAEVGKELTKASTKEGREERAAKRRGELRASLDGSVEDGVEEEEEVPKPALIHFRAPGDEEQYATPARPTKKKKKSSVASASFREKKTLRWDKALVYEGPLPGRSEVPDAAIIRRIELGEFGNSVATGGVGAKPVAVHVKRLIYKDDEI